MNFRILAVSILACLAVVVSLVHAQSGNNSETVFRQSRLESFGAPAAASVSSPASVPVCGTTALGNNDVGSVVSLYPDADVVPHAFPRSGGDGKFISVDAPGAGLGFGVTDRGPVVGQSEGPDLSTDCRRGEIAGCWIDGENLNHAFLWFPPPDAK